jgi:hypothetical protein
MAERVDKPELVHQLARRLDRDKDAFRPEKNRFVCPVPVSKLISIARQPVPAAAIRCYLIQMLR